jgi:hypothetical protein
MKALDFIVKSWSQIVILIGALGYILKIILDFTVKKKEIKYAYVYTEKARAFKEFTLSYQKLNESLIETAFQFKYENTGFGDFEMRINGLHKELNNNINVLYIYCSEKEKEQLYRILNSCKIVVNDVKEQSKDSIEDLLERFRKTNLKIISEFARTLTN